ncbi:MAG: hypothetical protein BJ554DRAFT_4214, partial [Olpidium bornovanus]
MWCGITICCDECCGWLSPRAGLNHRRDPGVELDRVEPRLAFLPAPAPPDHPDDSPAAAAAVGRDLYHAPVLPAVDVEVRRLQRLHVPAPLRAVYAHEAVVLALGRLDDGVRDAEHLVPEARRRRDSGAGRGWSVRGPGGAQPRPRGGAERVVRDVRGVLDRGVEGGLAELGGEAPVRRQGDAG